MTQDRVRICMATSYDAKFMGIGDYAAMTHRLYGERHGLTVVSMVGMPLERPPAWHRVQWIPKLLGDGFDYVLWIDADAVFRRFDVDIRSVIDGKSDLYMVQHSSPVAHTSLFPNTGVMLVRNSTWCRELFAKLWSMEGYLTHRLWENAALCKLLGYNCLLGEGPDSFNHDLLSHISWLPTDWNHIPSICIGGEPIIRHYAGFSDEARRREIPVEALRASFIARGVELADVSPELLEARWQKAPLTAKQRRRLYRRKFKTAVREGIGAAVRASIGRLIYGAS